MKVAVVVGHSKTSQGAMNKRYDVTEFQFFESLAQDIKNNFSDFNMSDEIVVIHRENGYAKLPFEINSFKVDLVVSLHANAFNTQAEGCEMLYYHKSKEGKRIATIFQNRLQKLLANTDRGIKPKTSEDRGGYLLKETHAPCIICEPFFIDNDEDFGFAQMMFERCEMTTAYCEAINEATQFLRTQE